MSEGVFMVMVMALPITLGIILGIRKRKKLVKLEDANVPGQIKAIVEQVVGDSTGYKVVPAISKQSDLSMLKDSFKDAALSKLTGHHFYTYEPQERFILIFGNMEMFFVPTFGDPITKKLTANFAKVTKVSVEDLRKVKSNRSGSSITLIYENKVKFLFDTLKKFYFPGLSAEIERKEFAEFIGEFAGLVNNK